MDRVAERIRKFRRVAQPARRAIAERHEEIVEAVLHARAWEGGGPWCYLLNEGTPVALENREAFPILTETIEEQDPETEVMVIWYDEGVLMSACLPIDDEERKRTLSESR